MAKFCGKCGSRLDEVTELCPNCDAEKIKNILRMKSAVASVQAKYPSSPERPSVPVRKQETTVGGKAARKNDVREDTREERKSKRFPVMTLIIVLLLALFAAGITGALVYFDVVDIPMLSAIMGKSDLKNPDINSEEDAYVPEDDNNISGEETDPLYADENKTVKNAAEGSEFLSAVFIDPINDWQQYDDLIAQIKAETDMAKRTEMMHRAEDILMSNWCILPLYYYNDTYLQKDYVDGIYSNVFGTKFFMYAKLSNGKKLLRLNLSSEPDYLDPALDCSVDGACLAANSFSGLYTYNKNGVIEGACATGYKVTGDGLEYIVTLREGLKWSDGSPLTAHDFEYAWKRVCDPETAADYAYMFSGFDGFSYDGSTELNCKALDDTHLYFKLSAPCAYIEDLMASPTFFPVKQSAVESCSDWQTDPGAWCREAGFVSNGAYVCTEWRHNKSMVYEKNPYWYDADKVEIERLEFVLSLDNMAMHAAYNAGKIDFMDSIFGNGAIRSKSEFHVVDKLGTYYAVFNCKSKIFDGKTPEQAACMRKALNILIDRKSIVKNFGKADQKIADALVPPGMADGKGGVFYTKGKYFNAEAINEDTETTLEQARTLLKAAGYEFGKDGKLSADTPLVFKYLTIDNPGYAATAESMQQDFKQLGIDMTIDKIELKIFFNEFEQGNYDFTFQGWITDFNDPIGMLEMWTSVSHNRCQYGKNRINSPGV